MHIEGTGALVAGGASGLGEATTRRLHAGGAHVVIADLNEDRGRALESELGDRATFVPTDVTDEASVLAAVSAAA
jgi:3-hydroxyacyl-CoA dehydrogenase/3-hydroxy-2-methylbutyryl-CoA dehydrogenase